MTENTKNLYNPHAGLTGRDGGPYLDQEERRLAEVRRAAIEGREPDFDNAPAVAGTPLVTAGQLIQQANPTSNPSQANADPYAYAVDSLAQSEDFPVDAFSKRPVDDDEVARSEELNPKDNPASPLYVSDDSEGTDPETREIHGVEEYDDEDDALEALTVPDTDSKKKGK